ncbi:hypothetical protein GCM10010317_102110 [Streptomyces mirabilis]|nr:hypothetical protein GCM10010317_102110 [Streptomyces mirabilis]
MSHETPKRWGTFPLRRREALLATRGTRQVGCRPTWREADNRELMAQLNRGRDAPINPDWKRRGAGVGLRFVRATACQAQGLRFLSVVAK